MKINKRLYYILGLVYFFLCIDTINALTIRLDSLNGKEALLKSVDRKTKEIESQILEKTKKLREETTLNETIYKKILKISKELRIDKVNNVNLLKQPSKNILEKRIKSIESEIDKLSSIVKSE